MFARCSGNIAPYVIFIGAAALIVVLSVVLSKRENGGSVSESEEAAVMEPVVVPPSPLNLQDLMRGQTPTADSQRISRIDKKRIEQIEKQQYPYEAALHDVSGGVATGIARSGVFNGTYNLYVTLKDLPDPKSAEFYEGWIVRTDPLRLVSTGKVGRVDGSYTDIYLTGQDLTDHPRYVLTLEQNDGNPAPATHIMEGELGQVVPSSPPPSAANPSGVVSNAAVPKVVNLSAKNFVYSAAEIRVKEGERVRVIFASTQGYHDWVVDEFSVATKRVNEGQTAEVEFVADKKGSFVYYCSVGNHRELGMTGTLIVE